MLAEIAYIFPDTRPKDEVLFPLVQLFTQAVYLAPVENDLPKVLSPLAKDLLAQDILRFDCPAPLGNDRERFLCLVKELRQRPADYAHLALTGLSNQEPAESKNAIMSAVRKQRDSATESKAAAFWQARLVLKLGEMIEQEEEEIRQSLHQLALREHGLLQALRDNDQAAAVSKSSAAPPDNSRARLRLKAWQKLFTGNQQLLPSCIFITSNQDAFDALIEKKSMEPQSTVTLSLPAFFSRDSDLIDQRHNFQQATAHLINDLLSTSAQETWEKVMNQYYPEAEYGRAYLLLYVLSGKFFTEQDEASALTSGAETVIGVLKTG